MSGSAHRAPSVGQSQRRPSTDWPRKGALQSVPHDRALLTDTGRAAHGPQPPHRRDRRHHGAWARISRLQFADAQERRIGRRGPSAERLWHLLVRQEPQRPRLADERRRSVRPVADQSGLRIFLRLHRRRRASMEHGRVRGDDPHRAAAGAAQHAFRRDHGRQGHRVDPASRRHSRPTSRSSSTTRPVRPTRRTMRRRTGSRASRGNSIKAGTRCARRRFERQKRLGVVPANTKLTPRPQISPRGTSPSADQKPLYARMMEVYCGALAHADLPDRSRAASVGQIGQRDNTLVIFIQGDNGPSVEGSMQGTTNEVGNRRQWRVGRPTFFSP